MTCDHSSSVCQSPKFLVASTCYMPDVINCQLRQFAPALLGPVHFLLQDQQSGIHCLIICTIQLLTPNNLGGTWSRICLPDIRSVSALEVLRNCNLQSDIYLLTYLISSSVHAELQVSTCSSYDLCHPDNTQMYRQLLTGYDIHLARNATISLTSLPTFWQIHFCCCQQCHYCHRWQIIQHVFTCMFMQQLTLNLYPCTIFGGGLSTS